MGGVLASLTALFQLGQGVIGALDTVNVKEKLFRQKDEARERLADVLVNLENTYLALDSELARYLGVKFDLTAPDDSPSNAQQREKLVSLEGGTIRARVEVVRAHCSQIQRVYRENLQRWFADRLQKDEATRLAEAFYNLGGGDGKLVRGIIEVADWIDTHAKEALRLVEAGQLAEANDALKQQRVEMQPQRSELTDTMAALRRLAFEALQDD